MPAASNNSRTDPLLAEFLQLSAAPCPSCRQPLVLATDDRCARCRDWLVLDVAMADSGSISYLVGAIGLAVGAGFNLPVVAIALATIPQPFRLRVLPLFLGAVLLPALLAVWIARRRRIRVWSPAWRRLAAGGCWILTFTFFAWMALNLLLGVQ